MNLAEYKTCSQCGLCKTLNDFPFENIELNIRRASCRECKNAADKKAYEESRDNPEKVARRILSKCRGREKERLARLVKKKNKLNELPDVELTEKEFNIDVEWMLSQQKKQNNKCYYTGLELVWSTGLIDNDKRINPFAVTVDRLDSSKGYIRSNCVLSCWGANRFKADGTLDEMLYFAFNIIQHNDINSNKIIKIAKKIKKLII